jgi:peptidase E
VTALELIRENVLGYRADVQLQAANAVLVDGGNIGYLSPAYQSGFAEAVHDLNRAAVYVGVSAGSLLATSALNYDRRQLAETRIF